MNPIRLSQDWPIIVRLAERYALRSSRPAEVQKFVDDLVDGTDQKKATVFTELLSYLSEQELLLGTKKKIFTVIKPDA